jgi:hypothetical protein
MKWFIHQTLSGVSEINRRLQPWARCQWAQAVVEWREQKEFYRFVDTYEKSAGRQEHTTEDSRNFQEKMAELLLIAWVDNRTRPKTTAGASTTSTQEN